MSYDYFITTKRISIFVILCCLSFFFKLCNFRWLEEIDRKRAEVVAAQISLEKLRQRDHLLKAENEMLKVEIIVYALNILVSL